MIIVVDASVALKWVLDEDDSLAARQLLQDASVLLAPDHLALECASSLVKRVRRRLLLEDDSAIALEILLSMPVRWEPARSLVKDARSMAIRLQASAYDCLYLVLAEREGAELVTADERFRRTAEAAGYARVVRGL